MADNKKKKKSIKINPNFKIKNIYAKPKQKPQKNSYKIIKKIGEGSFGIVYLAQYLKTSTLCVVKKIDFKGLSKEEIKESFNEVNLLKKLDHPNIIKFIEVKPTKKYIEIITEYAEKGDLYNQLNIQKEKNIYFPEKIIIDWLIQTCQALKYIHSKHIIHRDIKPHNIFLTKKGSIKLGDFGVSKTLNNTLEKAKTFVGTAYYLPPEVINGKKYSYMADMWSLGVTFYQLMTFKTPFNGNMLPALLKKISSYEKFEKISEKYYSKDLIDIIYKMMDYKPSKRPTSNDILNMEFIKKRIEKYLEENQFDNLLSKTIIKNYQDNFGFNKNKKNIINDNNNNNQNLNKINEENNDIISTQENNENNISNNISNINNLNENNEEHFSFKNKIKFNNIINNEIATNSNSNSNINISDTKKSNDKSKISLGQILLNNNTELNKNSKEKEIKEVKEIIEFPKIKIKIIPTKKFGEKKILLENNKNCKNKKDGDINEKKFEMTTKTDMTSYNPEDSAYKFKFEDDFIDKNKIFHENGDQEIELNNEQNYFFLETKKENEMTQELKEEYDHQRNLNLLNSIIIGKTENEIENENKLMDHNISDIEEEDDKENEEDIWGNNDK